MERWVIRDMPWNVDYEAAKQRLRVDEDDEPVFAAVYADVMALAQPAIYYGRERPTKNDGHTVEIGGQTFTSRILSVNLRGLNEVYPYILTSGRAAYEYANAKADPLEGYWAHELCEMVLKSSTESGMRVIRERLGGQTLYSMNPGSLPDWPISQQRPLFELLGNVYEACGVELTPSFLMLPVKSGSGIWFASDEHYANCTLCPRDGCPHRRAAFEPNRFMEKYGE